MRRSTFDWQAWRDLGATPCRLHAYTWDELQAKADALRGAKSTTIPSLRTSHSPPHHESGSEKGR